MPVTDHFKVEILVGDLPIPEYERNDDVYVESNLDVRGLSYHVHQYDRVGEEYESQKWPVTPYKIRIIPNRGTPMRYFDVFVDGIKVKSCSGDGNKERVISGFKDKNCVREFLFSLPRFPTNEDDRLTTGRETRVGTIEVECYEALLKSTRIKQRKRLSYSQANKKDCVRVTKGEFTMSTTKVGNVIYRKYPNRVVHVWRRLDFLSKVSIRYRMGHSLQEMGFKLKPYQKPEVSTSSSDEAGPSTSDGRRRTKHRPKRLKVGNSDNDPIVLGDSESDEDCVPIKGQPKKVVTVDLTEEDEDSDIFGSEPGSLAIPDDIQVANPIKKEKDSLEKGDTVPKVKAEKSERVIPKFQRTSSESPLLTLSHNSHESSPIARCLPKACRGSSVVPQSNVSSVSEGSAVLSSSDALSQPVEEQSSARVSLSLSVSAITVKTVSKSPLAKCTTVANTCSSPEKSDQGSVSAAGCSPNSPSSPSAGTSQESEIGENGGYAVF